jgi:NADP-dependent 3-hydroxy acid dehydrogenase YdfG
MPTKTNVCKSILITGAGAGIGATTAQLFVKNGWYVGLYDRDLNAVQALADALGENAHAGLLDVTQAEQWDAALADFMAWRGQLDVLLNNAGILYSGPFESIHLDEHARLLQVNVQGVINGCHAALPYLQQSTPARVINLSSASALYGQQNLATYSASKFAVRGLTEALDGEWARYGIRVMDIMPLFVQTAMVKDMNAGSIKRMGVHLTPDDVATVIWRAANAHSSIAPTHWPVGWPARALYHLIGITPDRINKLINSWLGR